MGLTKRLWREGGEYFWHEMRRSLRLSAAVVLVLIGLSVFAPASRCCTCSSHELGTSVVGSSGRPATSASRSAQVRGTTPTIS